MIKIGLKSHLKERNNGLKAHKNYFCNITNISNPSTNITSTSSSDDTTNTGQITKSADSYVIQNTNNVNNEHREVGKNVHTPSQTFSPVTPNPNTPNSTTPSPIIQVATITIVKTVKINPDINIYFQYAQLIFKHNDKMKLGNTTTVKEFITKNTSKDFYKILEDNASSEKLQSKNIKVTKFMNVTLIKKDKDSFIITPLS